MANAVPPFDVLNPTASFNLPDRALRRLSAAWTTWQCAQQGACEADAQSGDGVRHMALRARRQHLWVDNRRERQIAGGARREDVLRGGMVSVSETRNP